MKNRVLSYLILVAFVLSGIPVFALTASVLPDNVFLDYNFDEYEGSKTFGSNSSVGNKVTLTGISQKQDNKLYLGIEDDGNKYLYSDYDAYFAAGGTSWANIGFNVNFDAEFASTGTYAVSFDLRMDAGAKDTTKDFVIRHNDKSFYSFAANSTDGKFYGYKSVSTIDENGEEGTPYAFTPGRKYKVDLVYDLDNDTFKSYVDGTLLADREYTGVLAGQVLRFNTEQEISFFDNLKVAKITDGSLEATVTLGTGKIDVVFTETMADGTLDGAEILNTVTGEIITPTEIVKNNAQSFTLTIDEVLTPGTEYVIQTQSPIENFLGNELSKTLTFSTGEGKYVKSVKLVDYKGNEYYPGEDLPPEIKVIKVYYTGMEASDEPGSQVALSCESQPLGGSEAYDAAKQILTYTLDEYLIGEKDYQLCINDALIGETYEDVEFSAAEGSISINKFAFTKTVVNEGVPTAEQVGSLSDLSDGDVIDLEIEIIKTTGEAKDMSLFYSAWASGFMKGFDFKDVSMAEGKTFLQDKITGITISKDSTLTLDTVKGFLWTALGSNNPLVAEIVLE